MPTYEMELILKANFRYFRLSASDANNNIIIKKKLKIIFL